MRYENPWAEHESFVPLGLYTYSETVSGADMSTTYELYALVNSTNYPQVHFGARYGNAGEDYLSGEAVCAKENGNPRWHFYGGHVLREAMLRYFVNHIGLKS